MKNFRSPGDVAGNSEFSDFSFGASDEDDIMEQLSKPPQQKLRDTDTKKSEEVKGQTTSKSGKLH